MNIGIKGIRLQHAVLEEDDIFRVTEDVPPDMRPLIRKAVAEGRVEGFDMIFRPSDRQREIMGEVTSVNADISRLLMTLATRRRRLLELEATLESMVEKESESIHTVSDRMYGFNLKLSTDGNYLAIYFKDVGVTYIDDLARLIHSTELSARETEGGKIAFNPWGILSADGVSRGSLGSIVTTHRTSIIEGVMGNDKKKIQRGLTLPKAVLDVWEASTPLKAVYDRNGMGLSFHSERGSDDEG